MPRLSALLAVFGLLSAPVPVALAQEAPPALSAEDKAAVRCSAAFAIVDGGQARGDEGALGHPPLASRGREFFVQTGARLTGAGWSREQVAATMESAAADLQREARASGDADGVIAAMMPACLALLDAAVPPLATPTLAQCAAILRLSYEEVHAREGLSGRAKDLLTLASVLEARQRRALVEAGETGADADRALALARDAMLAEATGGPGIGGYDVATCFDLAKPEERTHY